MKKRKLKEAQHADEKKREMERIQIKDEVQRRRLKKQKDEQAELERRSSAGEQQNLIILELECKAMFLQVCREKNLIVQDAESTILSYCGWNFTVQTQKSNLIDVEELDSFCCSANGILHVQTKDQVDCPPQSAKFPLRFHRWKWDDKLCELQNVNDQKWTTIMQTQLVSQRRIVWKFSDATLDSSRLTLLLQKKKGIYHFGAGDFSFTLSYYPSNMKYTLGNEDEKGITIYFGMFYPDQTVFGKPRQRTTWLSDDFNVVTDKEFTKLVPEPMKVFHLVTLKVLF